MELFSSKIDGINRSGEQRKRLFLLLGNVENRPKAAAIHYSGMYVPRSSITFLIGGDASLIYADLEVSVAYSR